MCSIVDSPERTVVYDANATKPTDKTRSSGLEFEGRSDADEGIARDCDRSCLIGDPRGANLL